VSDQSLKSPGITFLSVTVSCLSLLLLAILIQFFEIIEGSFAIDEISFARNALAVPAILIFLLLLAVGGLYQLAARSRLISRPEALCILFCLLIAAPIMSVGFWGQFIGTMGTIPRSGEFEKMAALPDRLWPHGENLLAGALADPAGSDIRIQGDVRWEEAEYEKGAFKAVPVLRNSEPNAVSTLRVRIPVAKGDEPHVLLGEAYIISVLARATDLGAETIYYGRIYYDDADSFSEEAFSTSAPAERSITRPMGFQRFGAYGLTFASTVREALWVEFGLEGNGKLELLSPRFRSVRAFENAYEGRSTVTESEWETLTPNEQQRSVMKPDDMLSLAGLAYITTGYIPWADWKDATLAWFVFIALVLTGTFSVAVIMRRQWIQNERFPLPVAQIPIALIGGDLEGHADTGQSLWRNRIMWLGFGFGLFWCLMQGWAAYDQNVPNMNVNIMLKPYFADPEWGHMWTGVFFSVSAIFLSLAIFMEINVLMSLVVGYFIFRAQFWFGHQQGLSIMLQDFPYGDRQEIGAYLAYALLILFFTRKYLMQVLKLALFGVNGPGASALDTGRDPFKSEEARGYRFALLAIVLCFGGISLWARWVDLPVAPMLLFFAVVLLVGLVAARIRAECGAPFVYYFPYKLMMVISILGGIGFFKAEGYLFVMLASLLMFSTVFLIIPGLQLELLDLGSKLRVPGRHLATACMIGVVGGFLVGGWVHLSSFYALGTDQVSTTLPLGDRSWDMLPYNHELQKANSEFQLERAEATAGQPGAGLPETDPAVWSYAYAGGLTTVVAVLRQMFAGFWFHPVGIILGPSRMLEFAWGSCLVAAGIRFLVLRLGGAITVRQKLLPFFLSVFISAVAAHAFFGLTTTYMYFFKSGSVRFPLIF
jgi:hypothetical protein|tara:strand:- start:2948 stop:5587 length:2640 start_codon:yes stop_codon:yes gene_type:complete